MTESLRTERIVSRSESDADGVGAAAGRGTSSLPDEVPVALPLTGTQRAIWMREQLLPGTEANIVTFAVRVAGRLDTEALRTAFDDVVRHHDLLRASIIEMEGVPAQRVRGRPADGFRTRSAVGWDDARIVSEASAAAFEPFDLEQGPLVRLTLFEVAPTNHVLLISAHHVVADLWSLALFGHELAAGYEAALGRGGSRATRPSCDLQQLVDAEHRYVSSAEGAAALAFWQQQLRGVPALSTVPYDRVPGRSTGFRGALERVPMSHDDVTAIRRLAAATGTSAQSVLLTCLAVAVARWNRADRLVLGVLRANRSPRSARAIACLVNPVAVVCDLSGDPTSEDAVRAVHDASTRSAQHGRYPAQLLLEELRPSVPPGTTPWFQVVMSWQKTTRLIEERLVTSLALDTGTVDATVGVLDVGTLELRERGSPYDVSLLVAEDGDEVVAALEYRRDLYETVTMRTFAQHLTAAVRSVTGAPDGRLSDVRLTSSTDERADVSPDRTLVTTASPGASTIHERFFEQAARTPGALAVVDGRRTSTYAAVAAGAESWAARLTDLGVAPGDRVAVLVDRDVELPAILLGILSAGAAYVPLDPSWPPDRLRSVMAGAGVTAVVTAQAGWLPGHLLHLDPAVTTSHPRPHSDGRREQNALDGPPERCVAYVMHTSGSSGRPKGVVVEHGSVVALFDAWCRRPGLTRDDVVLASTTVTFDISVVELLFPLLAGARVVVAPSGAASDPRAMARLVEQHDVTVVQATPTTWRMLVDDGMHGAGRVTALCGGEAMSPDLAAALVGRFRRVWNLYGPTEATIWASAHEVRPGDSPVPLGEPFDGVHLYVLDERRRPVPPGVPGELWIGGTGVARGYHAAPVLTDERFCTDPFSGGRMYRTGDLVCRRPDGRLLYLGRLDDQIKLRGHRIEPGEIEAVLNDHPAVSDAAVTVEDVGVDDRRLVAHVVLRPGTTTDPEDVRAFARSRLPAPMVPAAVAVAERLPMTTNGKLDRSALPPVVRLSPAHGALVELDGAAKQVAEVWASVLGVGEVGMHDDFFDLGGHSLLATQIASRLRARLALDVGVGDIFETRTLARLLAAIDSGVVAGPALAAWRPEADAAGAGRPPPDALHRLSHSQERMWFVHQIDPAGSAYNLAAAVDLHGPLDVDALVWAVDRLVERHETLRTTFHAVDGVPYQRVEPAIPGALVVVDHTASGSVGPLRSGESLDEVLSEAAVAPFDLTSSPLARFVLHRLTASEHVLLVVLHHIVSDQWSFGVMSDDLAALYRARRAGRDAALPPVGLRLADFVAWQRDEHRTGDMERQLRYWRDQLRDLTPVELPADRPRPAVRSSRGATISVPLPEDLDAAMSRLGRELGATPFMIMLAAFQLLVSRYADVDDVAVGTPIANRNIVESEHLVSSFVNVLVMRTDLAGDPTFRDVVGRVRSVALESYANQDVPFARLVEELHPRRDPSRSPLFQVFFNVQNAPVTLPDLGVQATFRHVARNAAQFDLSFTIDTAVSRTTVLEYSSDLFDEPRMTRFIEHYWMLLRAGLEDPDRRAHDLPILSPAEEARSGASSASGEVHAPPLHEAIWDHASAVPDAIAVVDGDRSVTYAGLTEAADRLAAGLAARGIGPGDLVGIARRRSLEELVAVLATWRLGAAFVPLDPDLPAERLRYIALDAGVDHVLVDEGRSEGCTSLSWADGIPTSTVEAVTAPPPATDDRTGRELGAVDDRTLAYVIYTSGSTGRPKGVEVEHRQLAAFVHGFASRLGLSADSVSLATTTLSFDISLVELVLPLVLGGRVVLVARDVALHAGALSALVERVRPTLLQATPTAWRFLLDDGFVGAPDATLLCGGEPMSRELADRLLRRGGAVWNVYGPTETTIWATAHRVVAGEDPVPIGSPLPGFSARVVDRRGRPVPTGVTGELVIGGTGVARGYRDRPDLTAQYFVPDPNVTGGRSYRTGDRVVRGEDGELRYLGRSDHQVKIRGVRIELGEVEAVLTEHPLVRHAVVVVRPDPRGDDELVAFVVLGDETGVDDAGASRASSVLRRFAATRLPSAVVPAAVVTVDELPLTSNGKIDRNALRAPSDLQRDVAARPTVTASEARICALWERVLRVHPVNPDDDFFDLGGHSLLALRIIAELERMSGRRVPLTSLFGAPTPALLARALRDEGWTARHTSLVPVRPTGSRQPLFYVSPFLITAMSFANLARQLHPDRPFYVLQPQGFEHDVPAHDRIEAIAAHYLSELRDVQSVGPYLLGGHCSGADVAIEMAHQLQSAGEAVALLIVVDADPPGVTPPPIGRVRHATARLRHYWKGRRLLDAISWQIGLAVQRIFLVRVGSSRRRRMARVRDAHARAHAAYSGAVVSCDGLVVRSEEWASLPDKRRNDEWHEVITGTLTTVVVPGTHASLVENRQAANIAHAIEDTLARRRRAS